MAQIQTGNFTVATGGAAQTLYLGAIPSFFEMYNDTQIASPTSAKVCYANWFSSMPNASAFVETYNATPIQVLTKITTNGFTPYFPGNATLWPETLLTITEISKAAQASITATHNFTAADIGVTTVTFSGIVGMTQMNTLRGVIQSVTSTTSFTVNINSTAFTT